MRTRDERSLYDSSRLARAYACDRPPVHRHIIDSIRARIGATPRLQRALDVGCGAGLSTSALAPLADRVVGLEPMATMLSHRDTVARAHGAQFVVGQAERLPFPEGAFDLMTAAGSLDYVDLGLFLPEAARVLATDGVLAIYDFSAGCRLRESTALTAWWHLFEQRYPPPPGHTLDAKNLAYDSCGLSLEAYDEMEVVIPMTIDSYLPYAMSETSVESAISNGMSEQGIRDWCRGTLPDVFGNGSHDVLFDAYVAYVSKRAGKTAT